MSHLRFWLRLIATFLSRFKGPLFLAIIGGILLFFVFKFAIPFFISQNTTYIGISGRYRTDDLPDFIVKKIGQGLTTLDDEGLPQPALASTWSTPDNGKTWIFTLNENIEWQDGTEVTSKNIQYNFEDVRIHTPKDNVIIFQLQNIFGPFPNVVARPTFKKGLIGTGEWTVKKIQIKGGFVERLELVNSAQDREIYKFYPSEDSAKTAFKLGHIDTMLDLIDPEPFIGWESTVISESINTNRYVAVFLNNTNATFNGADKKSLRQALSYAIDKDVLGSQRTISPISPNSWAYNPQVKQYTFDIARAKELLGEQSSENAINITLTTTPALLPVADKVAKDWANIGVNTTVQVSSTIPDNFQAFLAIYNIPSDPDQYSTWHSTQIGGGNVANYQNPRIDKLLEDGRLVLDKEERKKIYLDFQRFLLEDAPTIFLYHPISYTVSRK